MRICILISLSYCEKLYPYLDFPLTDDFISTTGLMRIKDPKQPHETLLELSSDYLVAGYLSAVKKMWTGSYLHNHCHAESVVMNANIQNFAFPDYYDSFIVCFLEATRGHSPAYLYLVRSGDLWFFFERDLQKKSSALRKHSVFRIYGN